MIGSHPLKPSLERRVRALVRSLRPTLAGDVEPLHQCRVATRRLRELLPLCGAELSGRVAARARKRVRSLGRALGPVRELDVALGLITELEQEGRARPAATIRLRQRVREERERQRNRMLVRLKPAAIRKAEREVTEVLKALGMRDATDEWALVLATRMSDRADRLRDAVADAGPMYVSERVHEVRIAAKKLRYAVELAAETGEVTAPTPSSASSGCRTGSVGSTIWRSCRSSSAASSCRPVVTSRGRGSSKRSMST